MTSTTKSRPRVKAARSIKVLIPLDGDHFGAVQFTVGKLTANYYLWVLPSNFGTAYKPLKEEPTGSADGSDEMYHVNINGEQSTCECKGFLHHGHCKHVGGLTVLHQRNLI